MYTTQHPTWNVPEIVKETLYLGLHLHKAAAKGFKLSFDMIQKYDYYLLKFHSRNQVQSYPKFQCCWQGG